MINVEVTKNTTENTANLLRRFTRKIQGSGVLPRIRSIRYWSRPLSDFKKKKSALRKIERRGHFEELYKLGKIEEQHPRRRGFKK
jgi:ribosomal protein S21